MEKSYDVFISYSRKDGAIADRICEAFDKYGITYFIDRQGISGGMEFPDVLANAIYNSKLFLYLASKNSYDSKFTKSEITFAFNEKPHNSILIYQIDGSTMPIGMRFIFSSINWRNINEHPIETVLVEDVCNLLGKPYAKTAGASTSSTEMSADEMYALGDKYYNGNGVQQSYEEAVKWYRKAAEQDNASAQFSLGVCYDSGQGVRQDYAKAVEWYRKAAEQELPSAQYNLGCCYYNGQGVIQDYAKAVEWYRKAAEQGHTNAQTNLGYCYKSGQGVSQDYTKAVEWYRKAAQQGNAQAQTNLGYCYFNGLGVSQDYTKAVELYRKAAERGNTDAQSNLGYCYESGQGVRQDYAKAVEWYRKAAEQGEEMALSRLEELGYSR